MGANLFAAPSRRVVARMSAIAGALALCGLVASCGGRASRPVAERTDLDGELTCTHVIAEKRSLKARVADLRDERNTNRQRSLTRLPSAVLSGNPFSAIFLADPSVAIYREIDAANKRQRVLDELLLEKGCIEQPATRSASAPEPTPAPAPAPKPVVKASLAPAPAVSAETAPETAPKPGGDLIETWRSAETKPAASEKPASVAAASAKDDKPALIETWRGAN